MAELDEAHLASLVNGVGFELLREVVRLFLENLDPRVDAIVVAAAATDAEQLARAAHALKGAALSIGAAELANMCERIEMLGRAGDGAGAAGAADGIADVAARAARALETFVDARG